MLFRFYIFIEAHTAVSRRQQEAGHGLFELFFSGRARHHAKEIVAVKIIEQLWIEGIRRKLRIEKDSCVSMDIKIVHEDKKTEFMESYVEELQKKTKTFFLAAKQNSKNYYFHACERGNKPTGKSMGKACETRANSYEAYVSFKFIERCKVGKTPPPYLHFAGHDDAVSEEKLTPQQKALLQENPHPMFFMDASYKGLTSYGSFMIDRDLKELNAIREVFPKTKVLLCWFHVLQAVHRWVTSRHGGNLSPDKRHVVIHAMTSMKACITEEHFVTVSTSVCNDLDAQLGSNRVTTYLKVHWLPHAALWANFGRLFEHNSSDTNNKAER
ncbi:unnamed protein product [Leuciscus chuanchicus]